jgi:hypothetical protein
MQAKSSAIGRAVSFCNNAGGAFLYQVVEIDRASLDIEAKGFTEESVIVTTSKRSASYASANWKNIGVDVKTPFGLGGSFEYSDSDEYQEIEKQSEVWVTGHQRWLKAQLSLIPTGLTPAPAFKKAVLDAVAFEDIDECARRLRVVFTEWGYHYLAAVTMGASKHLTVHNKVTSKVSSQRLI